MEGIKHLIDIFGRGYKWLIICLTMAMFVVVGLNVICRYALNSSLGWADELARFMFIWVSFLGAVLAYHEGDHVGLNLFEKRIASPRLRAVLYLVCELGILMVILFIFYFGIIVARSATNVSPALYIPMKYIYTVVPISGFLLLLLNFNKLFRAITTLRRSDH